MEVKFLIIFLTLRFLFFYATERGHQMFAKYAKNFTSTSKNIFSKNL